MGPVRLDIMEPGHSVAHRLGVVGIITLVVVGGGGIANEMRSPDS
jgi:hypothetical protein